MTVEQYNRDLAAWEQQASGKNKSELQQKPPKKSAFERNSGIWMQKPGSETTQSVRNTGNAAVTMAEDADENTKHRGKPLRCIHRNALQVCGLQGQIIDLSAF